MSASGGRALRPLGRAARKRRDDRLFVVATEDTYAPKQYLEALERDRVVVVVLETTEGQSDAAAVVARVKEAQRQRQRDILPDDQLWVLLDTDHRTRGTHAPGFERALQDAANAGIRVAISNPCFEIWLWAHVKEFADAPLVCADLERELKTLVPRFSKTNLDPTMFHPHMSVARERARTADDGARWPAPRSTQVYRLLDEILGRAPE